MYKGGSKKKRIEDRKKKSSSRPFLAHPAGGQETTFYLRMAPGRHIGPKLDWRL